MCPKFPECQEIADAAGIKRLVWTNRLFVPNLLYDNTYNHFAFLSFLATDTA